MEPARLDPGGYTGTYKFVGGRLCLDLANTVSWPGQDRGHDWLDRYPNLIAWARQADIVGAREAAALLEQGATDDERSAWVLASVHDQRTLLRRIFLGLAQGRGPSAASIEALNGLLGSAACRLRVAHRPRGWTWAPVDEPERLTAYVIFDAAELIVDGDHSRLGQCPSCGWLYYDTTRNRSRRWCDMADCGSRDKARSYYRRRRDRTSTPGRP